MISNCKYCGKKFEQKIFNYRYCEQTEECKQAGTEAKNILIKKAMDKVKSDKEKKSKSEWKEQKKSIKENIKGIKEFKKDLERYINKICCLIDKNAGCISCNGITTPQAGHYHTVQSNGAIRFNLDNLHMQDYNCNCEKGGNIHKYDLGLIERYGKEYWEYVKFEIVSKYPTLKLHIHEYKEKISIAISIVKWLDIQNREFTAKERLELRKKFNEQLAIYN